MNLLLYTLIILTIFGYYGGKTRPNIIKNNKMILLGLLIGLLICKFIRIEGMSFTEKQLRKFGISIIKDKRRAISKNECN